MNMTFDPRAVDARPSTTELLTIQELAQVLRISTTTAYRMVDQREIPFHKVRGSLRFTRDDVDGYLRGTRVESKDTWK